MQAKDLCTRGAEREFVCPSLCPYERLSSHAKYLLVILKLTRTRCFTRPLVMIMSIRCFGRKETPSITNGFSEKPKTCSAARTRAALVLRHSVSRPTIHHTQNSLTNFTRAILDHLDEKLRSIEALYQIRLTRCAAVITNVLVTFSALRQTASCASS